MFSFLSKKLSGVLSWLNNKGRLTDENVAQALSDIKNALLEADVPLNIVESFLQEVKDESADKKVATSLNPSQQFIKIVHEKVLEFLGGRSASTQFTFQIPSVVMIMGLQGSGKTTTVAKLAYNVMQQAQQRGKKRRILLASVDFYRPAAIEQLSILANQVGVDFYRASAQKAVSAAKEIYEHFKQQNYDLLFLDTAGRLHVDTDMMTELVDINAKLSPKHKLLVLDAMTGQESLAIAQAFQKSVGFDAAIITKLDSDARGGAAFAFRYALKKPIAWVGVGEKMEDLESFIPERMTTRILGMGDIQTLIEKANESVAEEEQEKVAQRLLSGNFSLKDFYDQISMIDKLGSLQKISRYLPGAGSISQEQMVQGQKEMKKFKAIINSMTPKERLFPNILDASRKVRIAQGAGVLVPDINQLLQRFEQSKQFAKMFKHMGKLKRF